MTTGGQAISTRVREITGQVHTSNNYLSRGSEESLLSPSNPLGLIRPHAGGQRVGRGDVKFLIHITSKQIFTNPDRTEYNRNVISISKTLWPPLSYDSKSHRNCAAVNNVVNNVLNLSCIAEEV